MSELKIGQIHPSDNLEFEEAFQLKREDVPVDLNQSAESDEMDDRPQYLLDEPLEISPDSIEIGGSSSGENSGRRNPNGSPDVYVGPIRGSQNEERVGLYKRLDRGWLDKAGDKLRHKKPQSVSSFPVDESLHGNESTVLISTLQLPFNFLNPLPYCLCCGETIASAPRVSQAA